MFLIAHNQVILPKRYFGDIVPGVEELSNTVGATFLNKLILDENNRPIEHNKAIFSDKPVTRIVLMHFSDEKMFNQFWEAKKRQDLWLIGKNYAYFCDAIVNIEDIKNLGDIKTPEIVTNKSDEEEEEKISSIKILKKHGFSDREAEVMYWLCQGKSNGDIAIILNLSLSTVKKHISNIFDLMGVENRSSAVAIALELISAQKSKIYLVF